MQNYRRRYPCADCGAGYLECAAGLTVGLMCCAHCDRHPERFKLGKEAYTAEEIADMQK